MPLEWTDYEKRFGDVLGAIEPRQVQALVELLVQAREHDRTVFVIGNGGSAATASHAAEDLAKSTLVDFNSQRRLRITSLTDNTPAILAWANDEGYESIFVEQLKTFARPQDVLIAISGSGNSPNVLRAVRWGNSNGMITVGVTGFDGGALLTEAQVNLHVPIHDMGLAEAAHTVVFHYLVKVLCERFAQKKGSATQR